MARRALAGFAGLLAALGLLLFLGDLPGDYDRADAQGDLSLLVVDHGYHSGVILPRAALADRARALGLSRLGTVADRFVAYDHVEIGWGDEGFYRNVPGLSLQSMPHAPGECRRAARIPRDRHPVRGPDGGPALAGRCAPSVITVVAESQHGPGDG